MPDLSPAALIPAYQCAETIAGVAAETARFVTTVLVVDDGSTDETAEQGRRAGAEVFRRPANGGKGAAIRSGLEVLLARPQITHVLFLDGDGQHDPAEIPKFLAPARGGARFIVGSRMSERDSIPAYRYETNRIGDLILTRMTGHEVEDGQSGFRLVSADLLRKMNLAANGYLIETEMLLRAAALVDRFQFVPIRAIYGTPSHFRPFRDTWKISWGAVFIKVFET
jgi:glycosyltransferase involved in cell wall biosynthesis